MEVIGESISRVCLANHEPNWQERRLERRYFDRKRFRLNPLHMSICWNIRLVNTSAHLIAHYRDAKLVLSPKMRCQQRFGAGLWLWRTVLGFLWRLQRPQWSTCLPRMQWISRQRASHDTYVLRWYHPFGAFWSVSYLVTRPHPPRRPFFHSSPSWQCEGYQKCWRAVQHALR